MSGSVVDRDPWSTMHAPTVRSRLWASGVAFALGFAVANVGILRILGPDRRLWLVVAAVLMLTGAVGVLLADSRRRVSMWAVLGLEALVVAVGGPVLWLVTLAGSPAGPRDLWPGDVSLGRIGAAIGDQAAAIGTSLLLALVTSVVAVGLAAPAAHALSRRDGGRARARGPVGVVVALMLVPSVALLAPWSVQLRDLGWGDSRWTSLLGLLLLALPLALWFALAAVPEVEWRLGDVVRADGATTAQWWRRFVLPHVGPWVLLVAALVFVVVAQDAVVGATLVASDARRPVASVLLLADDARQTAAVALVWAVPAILVVLVAPRRTFTLLGRTGR